MQEIPAELAPLFDDWLASLAPLGGRVYGVYLYGSLALGAWNPIVSDIDAVVVTSGTWTSEEIERLGKIHADLMRRHPLAGRLQVIYFPLEHIGESNDTVPPYPAFRDGAFHVATHGDVNAVTWWLLTQHGLRLAGTEPKHLPIAVTWDDVRAAMRYNLDVYWERQVAMPGGVRFLHDEWVEFGVTTVTRILTTMENGEIIGKDAALAHWRTRLPARWRPLLDEAQRLRAGASGPGVYRTRLTRMRDARDYIRYVQRRCPAAGDQVSAGGSPAS
jgi:hypothetical protein